MMPRGEGTNRADPTTGRLPIDLSIDSIYPPDAASIKNSSNRRERRIENMDVELAHAFDLFRAEVTRIVEKREIAIRKSLGIVSVPSSDDMATPQ